MADGSRSSSTAEAVQSTGSRWARWLMPSVADVIFIVLLCAFAFSALSTKLLNDAGIGWHIRTGQQILASHTIPHVDPYSSIMAGKPWIAWEWLYDVAVGKLESAFGLNGVVWLTAIVIAGVFSWTFRLLMARGANLVVALLLMLLAVAASMVHILARPHVLSWLFAVLWYSILDSSEREALAGQSAPRGRWLWSLPFSMLVWVNVHGGFLLGFVLCGAFLVGAFWTWRTTRETGFDESLRKIAFGRRLRNLMAVTLLSAAASLVNPYGWKLHAHVLSYLTNGFFMDHIDEFQSPNFHFLAQKCFLALVILTLATMAVRVRTLKVSEALLVLFAMYAGLYASRNIPVSSILLVVILGPLLPAFGVSDFARRMTVIDSRLRGHLWPVVAVFFVLLVDWNGGRIGSKVLADAHFDPLRMPVGAVNNLEQNRNLEPVLTPDYWGGYLIYRLYPKTQVVIDDRHDLYGERILESYLKMVRPQQGWDDFLRDHHVSLVIMPKAAEITAILNETPGWKPIYSDDVAVTFIRTDSTKSPAQVGPSP